MLSRTEVSTRAFVELDNGKISFVDFKIKLAIKDNKDLCLKISYITSDFTKKFYLTLNDDLVRSWKSMTHSMPDKLEYQLSLRYMYNRVLDDYLPRSAEALYTIIQYKNGGPRIDSVVCTLLNHFIDRKARVKQLNGRTFVNLKGLTEGQIILHSLFKLLREYYFQLPELVCKQVITHNNFTVESSMASGFHGRRGRHNTQHKGQAIPIAYNFINDDGPSNNPGTYLSLQSVESRRIGYEKSILSYNMSETAYNPSAVLCSHLYRLEHNQIVEMGSLLLSSSAMMDINFNFATYVCRVKSSYFLVFLTISPPESFELWRQKDSKPNDMALSGTWIDKIGLRVQIYNCSQFKVTNVPFEMTFKEVVSHSHVSELERIYRALICGGMDLQTHSEIRDFTVRNLIVQENSLIWLDRKDSVKGSQASSVVLSDSKHEPPVLNSIPYNKLDPYKHLCERRGSRYDKPQMYSLSRKQKLDLLDDDIKLENSSLMPWGTRYKRMQLLPGLNKVFYTLVDMGTYRIKMVFFYSGEDNHERIRIKSFNTETDEVYNLTVTDPIKVTRIVHLIMKQKENDSIYLCQQFIKVSMNFFLNIDKRLSGRHYQVNDVYRDRVSIARQETVEQTKWNVVCMTETVYLRNFFLSKSLYFPTIHPLLGKLYIECRLYFSFKLSKNQAIALLIISPMRKRMTSYHLVINAVDLENYFDCNIFPLVHNNQELIKIFSKVISKLVLVKRKTYSIPALPLQLIKRRTSLSYTEVLKNVFDQRDLLKAEKDQEKTYLRKTIYHSEVIVKAVVKFNNQYWILTVVKNLLLDRIDIEAYVPSVKRKFQCRMTTHDYEYMTSNAETELSKRAPKLLQKLSDLATNYQQFEVMLRQDIDQDTIEMGLVSPQMISSKAIKKMKFSHSKSFGTLSGYESVKQLFQKNFQATKFWFDVLKKSKLILKHNDLLIEFETFRAVLKENIWQSLCFTGNLKYEITVDLDTERHFVATSKTVEVFNPIYIDKLDQYSFLLKVIFLREDQQHHVDKVNLDQLFKIYGLLLQEKLAKSRQLIEGKPIDNISKSEKNHTQVEKSHISEIESSSMQAEPLVTNTLPPISRLRLSDIRDLTRILELNVNDSINERYMSVIDSKLTYFNDEKVLSKQIIYQDKYERRMKLNSKLCLDIMTDPHYKQYNDVLISRHVFTVRPQQLLVILYNKRCKLGVILVAQFFFTVYNNIHCKVNETAMTVNEVKVHVPHVLVLIENKEFTEVGNRLYSVYKNTLLAYASLKSAKIGD